MKQLYISDEPKQMFFDSSITMIEFGKWVENKLWFDMTNPFNLNEAYSCDVNECENCLIINGDEDIVEMKLIEVVIEIISN